MTGKDYEQLDVMLKRHIGILSEEFQHRLGVVADGVLALDEKLDRNTVELKDEIQKSRDENRGLFASLGEKIDGVGQQLDEKIDGVENNLRHEMQSMGGKLDARIDGVEKRLGVRIDGVEQGLGARVDGVAKNLNKTREALTREIRAVGDKVEGHEARITRLEQQAA